MNTLMVLFGARTIRNRRLGSVHAKREDVTKKLTLSTEFSIDRVFEEPAGKDSDLCEHASVNNDFYKNIHEISALAEGSRIPSHLHIAEGVILPIINNLCYDPARD